MTYFLFYLKFTEVQIIYVQSLETQTAKINSKTGHAYAQYKSSSLAKGFRSTPLPEGLWGVDWT